MDKGQGEEIIEMLRFLTDRVATKTDIVDLKGEIVEVKNRLGKVEQKLDMSIGRINIEEEKNLEQDVRLMKLESKAFAK
jgi:hypothetical protein